MSIYIFIILGIIQGLTEFLPVSSSGHLVLLYQIFGIQNDTILLSVILHLATLLAVIIYYRKDCLELIKHPFCKTNRKIITTTAITCVLVLIFKPLIDASFDGSFLPLCFVITGILLWISDWCKPSRLNKIQNNKNLYNVTDLPITYTQAIIIGLSQTIACFPGISRSGTTIATSNYLGLKDISAKYSFLISIPIILASLFLQLLEGVSLTGVSFCGIAISFLICFLIGLLCISFMTKLLKKNNLKYFSIYLFALAIFILLNSTVLHIF